MDAKIQSKHRASTQEPPLGTEHNLIAHQSLGFFQYPSTLNLYSPITRPREMGNHESGYSGYLGTDQEIAR